MTLPCHPGVARHAVYFAPPPEHPLWRAGCDWLGRDARAGQPVGAPARPGVATPWRYGFHATLKAPMALRDGADEAGFLAAVRTLAQRHTAFTMPPLAVAWLDDFLALQPAQPLAPTHPLRRLADAVVRDLDPWRAPLTEAERARQGRPHHDARQRGHVERFGHAQVLDAWRCHLTLSDRQSPRAPAMWHEAQRHFAAALDLPLRCDALCVFVEPSPGAPFEWRHRFLLGS